MLRSDLFAVKQYTDTGRKGGWCVVAIHRSLEGAKQSARGISADTNRDFPLVAPKLCHPADWVVNAFLSVGNPILA